MEPSPLNESDRIDRTPQVGRALFEALVREHGPRLRLFLGAVERDPQAREELLQETLLVAWRRLESFDPDRSFGPWLRGIGRNLVLARQRALGRRGVIVDPSVLDQLEGLLDAPAQAEVERMELELAALRACLEGLPAQQRAVVDQRYREGRRGAELARGLGRSLESTKKSLQRVRARLHDCVTTKLAAQGVL
ncbi:sigma-70 family RNA polymerase sigma factor [Engelhardtia mirabilis]|uniref:ECF RNA polymerase sigma factor SigL n=1 Tax=Engelhardtia mirabilis TaxID=2528011 RepID=A0A518BGK3_9BACT|nr:ECF RNA polymerase sigma factor SigL [Planctomycetes bacterium Pla133]QDV00428.1 ECF RNA polymerase sigma factor SigL [Planctomycetes bacterium Pla86]